jgi:uncharacterized repeat protein (TIGR02543 family)
MDYDHRILKQETVKKGGNATAPAAPTRDGYTFIGWNRSYTNVTADIVVYALYEENESEAVTYTVKFVDYDGSVIDTQIVEEGEDAVAPADPIREGYTFVGWDNDFTNVTSNLTVKAMYEEIPVTDPMIYVSSVSAKPGDTSVQVVVSVKNNPGILGMTLKLAYDDSVLTLTKATNGSAMSALTMTAPGKFVNGCNFVWDAMELAADDIKDGEILILTFNVSAGATGVYPIAMSYTAGDIFDQDWNDLEIVLREGYVTIS